MARLLFIVGIVAAIGIGIGYYLAQPAATTISYPGRSFAGPPLPPEPNAPSEKKAAIVDGTGSNKTFGAAPPVDDHPWLSRMLDQSYPSVIACIVNAERDYAAQHGVRDREIIEYSTDRCSGAMQALAKQDGADPEDMKKLVAGYAILQFYNVFGRQSNYIPDLR